MALRGIYAIAQTPFDDRGGLHLDDLGRECDWIARSGAHGLVWPVMASEFTVIAHGERVAGMGIAVQAVSGRIPVVVGVADTSQAGAVDLAEKAAKAGADAIIAMPPWATKLSSLDLVEDYYRALAKVAGIPVIIQNCGPPLGSSLSGSFVVDLCRRIPLVQYLKEEKSTQGHSVSEVIALSDAEVKGVFSGASARWLITEHKRGICGNMPAAVLPDVDARTFIQTYTNNPEILDVFDSGTRYANAVDSEHASAQDLVTALRVQRRRFEGVVLGGCKSIIDELERKIGEASGRIHTQRPAACIRVEGQRAVAVVDEGGVELPADLVVCNADPKTSTRLLGAHAPEKLCALAEAFVPTHGITYCVGTTEPLVPHDGVELPLGFGGAVAGYHQVSNADPGLAPAGRHFLLAFQPLGLDENVEDAIARGRDELSNIFPSLKQKDVFHISVFQKDWPLAHVQQRLGQCGENRVPLRFPEIENLYFVGHSSVGRGLAAEVVADAALRLDRELGSP